MILPKKSKGAASSVGLIGLSNARTSSPSASPARIDQGTFSCCAESATNVQNRPPGATSFEQYAVSGVPGFGLKRGLEFLITKKGGSM